MAENQDKLGQQGSSDKQQNQQDEDTRTQQTKDALTEAIRKRRLSFAIAALFTLLFPSPAPGCDRRDNPNCSKGAFIQEVSQ
jgi:hypothetical protein